MLNDSSPILTACVFFFRRNRIVSKRTPWMTATDAFDREPAAFEKSMGFQGFNCVLRTCRYKSAGATASKQDLQRRKENPIKTDQKDEDPFHGRVIGWGEADEADISVRISLPQILPWSLLPSIRLHLFVHAVRPLRPSFLTVLRSIGLARVRGLLRELPPVLPH